MSLLVYHAPHSHLSATIGSCVAREKCKWRLVEQSSCANLHVDHTRLTFSTCAGWPGVQRKGAGAPGHLRSEHGANLSPRGRKRARLAAEERPITLNNALQFRLDAGRHGRQRTVSLPSRRRRLCTDPSSQRNLICICMCVGPDRCLDLEAPFGVREA